MKVFLSLLIGLLSSTLWAQSLPGPLVEGQWLLEHRPAELVVLDVQEPELFARHHIEGAVNWPFSQWRTDAQGTPPKSLPPLMTLAQRLGQLGIARDTPLLIVATGTGPGDMSAAARVYWTLSVLGHADMAVLNGGLVAYVNGAGGRFVRGASAEREALVYRPQSQLQLLANAQDLLAELDQPLLDARSLAEHVGLVAGEGERAGTLPDVRHLPFDWLVGDDGRIRSKAQIQKLFSYAGADDELGSTHFCHTGNRASLTWFADYALLGHQQARLYDGSMLEWAKRDDTPMVRALDLD